MGSAATNSPRNLDQAREMLEELQGHCLKKAMPPEIQTLGRTIRTWFDKLCNYHLAKVSNGPTEALNNLIKRFKRIGFGFQNFDHYADPRIMPIETPRALFELVVATVDQG
jgi:transposase